MGQHLLYWLLCSSHMGAKKLKDLLQRSPLKIRHASQLIDQIILIIKKCQARQLVNAYQTKGEKGT